MFLTVEAYILPPTVASLFFLLLMLSLRIKSKFKFLTRIKLDLNLYQLHMPFPPPWIGPHLSKNNSHTIFVSPTVFLRFFILFYFLIHIFFQGFWVCEYGASVGNE